MELGMPTLAGGARPGGRHRRGSRCASAKQIQRLSARVPARTGGNKVMAEATLTIASKNYGSWSLRGGLLCKLAGLDFDEEQSCSDEPSVWAVLLRLSPACLVPRRT